LIPLQRLVQGGICLFNPCERQIYPAPFLINIVGNVLILAPVGFALFRLTADNAWSRQRRILFILFSAFVLSTSVELLQLLYAGRFTDIDDILLNSVGAFLGAWAASRQEQNCAESSQQLV
jgi:glycopeptide antibiotics resistance protein